MSEFDPTSNGHRLVKSSRGSTRSSAGVVLVALVSACTGACALVGATAGALTAAALGVRGGAFLTSVTIGSAVGAVAGVSVGVLISDRFTRASSPPRGHAWPIAGGVLGLGAAVAVASRGLGPWAPVVVTMLPGFGALLGHTFALKRTAREERPG